MSGPKEGNGKARTGSKKATQEGAYGNVGSNVLPEPKVVNRWVQLIAGVIAMMAIANLQYAWTLFTTPLTKSMSATLAAVQVAFAAFILCETWLVPFEGYLIDRLGPRLVIGIGGILVGLGWIGSGMAGTCMRCTSGTPSAASAPVLCTAAAWATR